MFNDNANDSRKQSIKENHSPKENILAAECNLDNPLDYEKALLGCEKLSWEDFNNLTREDIKNDAKFSKIVDLQSRYKAQQELIALANDFLKKEDHVGKINLEAFPKILRDYIKVLCASTDAHPIMIISALMAAISAQLGTKVYIPKDKGNGIGYRQKLYTNLWILVVSDSGTYKTTALNTGASSALAKQKYVNEELEKLNEEYKNSTDEKRKEQIEEEKLEISRTNPIMPNRMTAEALLKRLGEGHKGVIIHSEFGTWLKNITNGYNGEMMGILTDIYDVPDVYENYTKSQGIDILKKPFICIAGVSTLAWLKTSLKEEHIKGGFGARFLIFAPLHEDKDSSMWPSPIDPEVLKAKDEFANTLNKIIKKIEHSERKFLPSESAKKLSDDFYKNIKKAARSYKCRESLEPFVNRWTPCMLKLAMIMQLFIDSDSEEISDKALWAALALLLPAIRSTASLFEGEFSETDEERENRKLYEWVCKKYLENCKKNPKQPQVSRRDICQSKQVKGKSKEYDSVIRFLVERGDIECVNDLGEPLVIERGIVPSAAFFIPTKNKPR